MEQEIVFIVSTTIGLISLTIGLFKYLDSKIESKYKDLSDRLENLRQNCKPIWREEKPNLLEKHKHTQLRMRKQKNFKNYLKNKNGNMRVQET